MAIAWFRWWRFISWRRVSLTSRHKVANGITETQSYSAVPFNICPQTATLRKCCDRLAQSSVPQRALRIDFDQLQWSNATFRSGVRIYSLPRRTQEKSRKTSIYRLLLKLVWSRLTAWRRRECHFQTCFFLDCLKRNLMTSTDNRRLCLVYHTSSYINPLMPTVALWV